MERTLLVRADGGPEIGTGHVMRCLALAQGWQDAGGSLVFATDHELPEAVERRLRSEGFAVERIRAKPGSVQDVALTLALASRVNPAYTVIDGYCFGADYQRALKDAGQKLLAIDDHGHVGRYCADLVLDQNSGAGENLYTNREPATQRLLGTKYTLLRREFLAWREWQREHPATARNVLVTMGGADPDNLTLKVIEALKHVEVEGLNVTVLVGAANPHGAALESAVRGSRSILLRRDAANVPSIMAHADVAIICGGGTLWELLFMGAAVLSYSRDPVQAAVLSEPAARGAATWLGDARDFDERRLVEQVMHLLTQRACRERMSRNARAIVDGLGVQRVLHAMGAHSSSNGMRMVSISASEKDGFMRMAAQHFSELNPGFAPQPDWVEHYFDTILANPEYYLRWLMQGNERAGFILFGLENHRFLPRKTGMIYEVYVAPAFRRKGIARLCAEQAIAEMRSFSPSKIQLETMEGNAKATALWESMGFRKVSQRFVLQEDRA